MLSVLEFSFWFGKTSKKRIIISWSHFVCFRAEVKRDRSISTSTQVSLSGSINAMPDGLRTPERSRSVLKFVQEGIFQDWILYFKSVYTKTHVLVLVFLFTLSWLPWILAFLTDIFYHSFEEAVFQNGTDIMEHAEFNHWINRFYGIALVLFVDSNFQDNPLHSQLNQNGRFTNINNPSHIAPLYFQKHSGKFWTWFPGSLRMFTKPQNTIKLYSGIEVFVKSETICKGYYDSSTNKQNSCHITLEFSWKIIFQLLGL